MRAPTDKEFAAIVSTVLSHYSTELINTKKWYNYFKKRAAEKIVNSAGFKQLGKALDSRAVFVSLKGRSYLLYPGKFQSDSEIGRVLLLAMLAHEMTHWTQCNETSSFYAKYLSDSGLRGQWEAQAMASEHDVYRLFQRNDLMQQPWELFDTEWCDFYAINYDSVSRDEAQETYELLISHHNQNAYATPTGAYACRAAAKVINNV